MYPYFIYPDVMKLRRPGLPEAERHFLTARVAANVGDHSALRIILGMDPEEFAYFYPDMRNASPSTNTTIDSFIDKFGGNIAVPGLDELISPIDKTEQLTQQSEIAPATPISHQSEPEPEQVEVRVEPIKIASPPRPEGDAAVISRLIRQRKYQEAIDFITAANLNNTKKNIYFASQISFLQKLLENSKKLSSRN